MERSNIEFKARCTDHEVLRRRARAAGAEYVRVMRQRDTYFRVPEGRLKLRVNDPGGAELVRYFRSDDPAARQSRYAVTPVRFPALKRWWLARRFGILTEVFKTRELWLWRGVRIHIDRVEGRGDFMELEAVVHDIGCLEEARRRCEELRNTLGIDPADICRGSYAEM